MENEGWSARYLALVTTSRDEFIEWLTSQGQPNLLMSELKSKTIKEFLATYKQSPAVYMNRRRNISALLSRILDEEEINPVSKTPTIKCIPSLHKPFNKQQLKEVLQNLSTVHENLYVCGLLMYGCLLRPHIEIRQLKREDFDADLKVISLGGKRNKGRKIRSVIVPSYVRDILMQKSIDQLPSHVNIFTGNIDNFQYYYFLTAWKRIKGKLVDEGIITKEHTLYSFRHTAAINIYRKTKDPYKVQRALGHASLTVTLNYLRHLGLMVNVDSENDLPDPI